MTGSPNVTKLELLDLLEQEGLLPCKRILTALTLAEAGHGKQKRDGGGSVLEEHIFPITADVVRRSKQFGLEYRQVLTCAALLHDIVEDCGVTLELIEEQFGHDVAHLVGLLTDVGKVKTEYLLAIKTCPGACLVKVCDRRNNLASFGKVPKMARRLAYCVESEIYLIPIAEVLGPDEVREMQQSIAVLRASST